MNLQRLPLFSVLAADDCARLEQRWPPHEFPPQTSIRLANSILGLATQQASDVHIEPMETDVTLWLSSRRRPSGQAEALQSASRSG